MTLEDYPLVDLHRHLEGVIRLQTIIDVSRDHNLQLPGWTVDTLRPYIQVYEPQPGIMAFLMERIKWMIGILVDTDVCERITYEAVEDAYREGISYLELRFSPWFMAEPWQLDPTAVVEAVVAGAQRAARDLPIKVNLVGIISRTYGAEIGWKELEALLSQKDKLVALDLAGDEINFPAGLFADHFKRARDVGWQITVHAGEGANTQSVWQAIQILGATRIGHGVNIIDDASLMDYVAQHNIGIEVNLTSNLQTSVVASYAAHPLRQFLARKLLVSINSDDPVISGIDLPHEYTVAAPAAGLQAEDLKQVRLNGILMAFLAEPDKQALLAPFTSR